VDELELGTGAPAAGGGFVARDPTGRVVFVRHALSGERVRAVVTEEHATWARADAIEILDASPDRVTPPCPFAGPGACGGCDYQHVDLAAQRQLKEARLAEQLAAVPDLSVAPEVEAAPGHGSGLGTRTKVRYGVDADGLLAMRRHASHSLVTVGHCPLAVGRTAAAEHTEHGWPTGSEVEVISLGALVDPTALVYGARGMARRRPRPTVQRGPGYAARQLVEVRGHRLTVSPESFFQVHEAAPVVLVGAVLEGLALGGGERVADLYCGVGLFTVAIAHAVGPTGSVVGVDASAGAVADARLNLAAFPWTQLTTASLDARAIGELVASSTHVVVDPPRRGLDRGVLDALCRLESVRRLVYVSCEPSTFARDLGRLHEGGWRTTSLRAFDLFEMTEHLECVAVLER
jgi:tRNA/tmRNA/rRNA uracil-C5-methylase (TrmA/RlmC/RlmD family)